MALAECDCGPRISVGDGGRVCCLERRLSSACSWESCVLQDFSAGGDMGVTLGVLIAPSMRKPCRKKERCLAHPRVGIC